MKEYFFTCLGVLNPRTFRSSIRKLFHEQREITMYLIFGVLTTAISMITFFLFWRMFDNPEDSLDNPIKFRTVIPKALSWICAVTFAYVTNRMWVFESKAKGAAVVSECARFFGARALSGLFDLGAVWLAVDFTGIDSDIYVIGVNAASNIAVLIFNYIFSKIIVFRKKKETNE